MSVIKATFQTYPASYQAAPESNVAFGCTCAVLLALASVPLSVISGETNPLPLMFGALCLLLVMWSPSSFQPFTQAWITTSKWIAKTAITLWWAGYILPSGLIMQAKGQDPLNLRFSASAKTYWKAPPPATSMQRSS